jgi:lactate permease
MAFFVRTLSAAGLGRVGTGWATLAAAGFLLPSLGLAAWLGPELATLGAALLSAAAVVAVLHGRRSRSGESADAAPALGRALWPYAVLVLAVLATRALPPLHGALNEVVLQWQVFGRYSGRLQPLTHPGTLLFLALLLGARLQGVPLRALGPPLMLALARLRPVALALLAMLCLSRLLLDAGMVQALQLAAVAALGQAWPLLAPALGALGSFVTGSATASNVLFSSLQAQTAQALGLPVAWLLAGQSLGAAVGNIVCPHNIVAGAATVGLAGREAEVLRRTWLPCMVYLVLAGLLLTLVSWR